MGNHEGRLEGSPPRSRGWVSRAACLVLCLALHGRARGQESIVLREQASIAPGAGVVLGDVATISGPNAEVLAKLPLVAAEEPLPKALSLDRIRDLLSTTHKQNMGRIALSGASVRLAIAEPVPVAPAPAPSPAPQPTGEVSDLPTVRGHALAALAAHANVEADAIRAEFAERDAVTLATHIASGQVVSITPTARASEVPLQVRVYAGDTLVLSETVRAKVSVRRSVLVATRDIDRGSAIDATNSRSEERWLPMSNLDAQAQALSQSPEAGAVAKQALRSGQAIGARHIALPVLIEKGDVVAVDCVRNGLVVRASLRALEDGKLNDMIELAPLASNRSSRDKASTPRREPPTVRARVVGAGRAVMMLASDAGETRVAQAEEAR
jgi:flagella basal body P-ring formation protein FlgA